MSIVERTIKKVYCVIFVITFIVMFTLLFPRNIDYNTLYDMAKDITYSAIDFNNLCIKEVDLQNYFSIYIAKDKDSIRIVTTYDNPNDFAPNIDYVILVSSDYKIIDRSPDIFPATNYFIIAFLAIFFLSFTSSVLISLMILFLLAIIYDLCKNKKKYLVED